ncbi:MAG: hypothetical protein ACLRMZ_11775 [Blautia marasmi]
MGNLMRFLGLARNRGGDTQEKREETDCGHGCGHNLLGTGSLAAAVAVKAYLEESGGAGTIVYFGCPGKRRVQVKLLWHGRAALKALMRCSAGIPGT